MGPRILDLKKIKIFLQEPGRNVGFKENFSRTPLKKVDFVKVIISKDQIRFFKDQNWIF